MKTIVSTSEIIGSFTRDHQELEVCATGNADFDEGKSELTVELDSFIRPVGIRAREEHLNPEWLPGRQTVHEAVSQEEAPDLAREIFHAWVKKVRQSVPLPLHN